MTKQQDRDDPQARRASISSWWDDELSGDDRALEALLADIDAVREQTRGYDRIGRCVRGESLETRDLFDAISEGLDQLPASDRPETDRVVPFPARVMQQRQGWQVAVAASVFAAVTAVGLTLSSGGSQQNQGAATMQAKSPTPNDRAIMASLNGSELPEGTSPISLAVDPSPETELEGTSVAVSSAPKLPDWATGRRGRDANPYVMTHYRLALPEFGTTGPEARAASFGRE